jgi:hypothetical protein
MGYYLLFTLPVSISSATEFLGNSWKKIVPDLA